MHVPLTEQVVQPLSLFLGSRSLLRLPVHFLVEHPCKRIGGQDVIAPVALIVVLRWQSEKLLLFVGKLVEAVFLAGSKVLLRAGPQLVVASLQLPIPNLEKLNHAFLFLVEESKRTRLQLAVLMA